MLDIIQLLPDYVANQIAAGEVVQRPSSIVKELLENAIDAGASKIELIIKEAGRTSIQVVDNGTGMSCTDARMAFERHATSKIKTSEDIFNIRTKGFRGEALASIAAVAQVELRTKQSQSTLGTSIQIHGGELVGQNEITCSDGANFIIKNLFYNVPARRKFLKSNAIEFRHILDEFHRVVLAHENIEFILVHNDLEILRLRTTNSMQRCVDVFGKKLQSLLLPVKENLDWVRLSGFIGKAQAAKKTRGEQFFFINGRYFRSPYLSRAVVDAFEGLLQNAYFPSFFLFIEMDPSRIDVNIHPQKTEVKFEDEQVLYALIRSNIKKSLGFYTISNRVLDFDKNPELDKFTTPKGNYSMESTRDSSYFNPFEIGNPEKSSPTYTKKFQEFVATESLIPSKINLFEDQFEDELLRLPQDYWLLQQQDCSFILDLERIHYCVYPPKTPKNEKLQSQMLLFTLEYLLTEPEVEFYKEIKPIFEKYGFDTEMSERRVLLIHGIPNGFTDTKTLDFVQFLFTELDWHGNLKLSDSFETYWLQFQMKSRKEFVMRTEVENLILAYKKIGFPEYTPNGKKCYITLPLESYFNQF